MIASFKYCNRVICLVGLTWKEAKERCPEGVVPACHNAEDTVTISGPVDSVRTFVAQLKEEGYFAREVASNGVAFHSYYMSAIAPKLRQCLTKVCAMSEHYFCFFLWFMCVVDSFELAYLGTWHRS